MFLNHLTSPLQDQLDQKPVELVLLEDNVHARATGATHSKGKRVIEEIP